MGIVYVISEHGGAGKTAVCMGIWRQISDNNTKVSACKLVSHVEDDADIGVFENLTGQKFITFDSSSANNLRIDEIKKSMELITSDADVVIAESSSDLSLDDHLKIAEAIDAKVLVVTKYGGDFSESLMTRMSEVFGERLVGYIVNGLTKYGKSHVTTMVDKITQLGGTKCFGIIPEDRLLLSASVKQILAFLDGEYLSDVGDTDALVEYLMVGGMSLDPGELYFSIHENRAIIVRGDRPDIQMSALSTDGNTQCIILTNGVDPIEYVRYEAMSEQIPIIKVQSNTLDTMEALNELALHIKFDHPDKFTRMADMVRSNVDVEEVLNYVR